MINKKRSRPNYDKVMWIALILAFLARLLPDSLEFYIPFIITLIAFILMIRYIFCKSSIIIIVSCFVLMVLTGIISAINLINSIYIDYIDIVPILWKTCAGLFLLSINSISIFLIKINKHNRVGIIVGSILFNVIIIAFMIFI